MNKMGVMLTELDRMIRELYRIRRQEGWKNKGLAEAQVHLIQAIFILGERGGTEHVYEG